MSKAVTVSIPHRLGRAGAVERLRTGMGQVRAQLTSFGATMEEGWNGDTLSFRVAAMGQTISGNATVREEVVDLEIHLPWMLAMLAERIKGKVQHQGTLLLERRPPTS
ncbi:MAG TPA: polyhydroxyalkanoic acid system family protein [Azospirillaceae bacterium]|nr:polyhydroxyalkanoic acid system family protein [Azospirillaceae bacterium]